MNRTLPRLLALAVTAALVAGAVMLYRQMAAQRAASLLEEAADLFPDVAQRIRDFHRVKVEGGRKVWEVSAREARYIEDEGLVVIVEPDVAFYTADGNEVSLRSREGRLFLSDRSLRRVHLRGSVRARVGSYVVVADEADYDGAVHRVVVPGRVRMSGGGVDVRATGVEVRIRKHRLSLRGPVRMTLYPAGDAGAGGGGS